MGKVASNDTMTASKVDASSPGTVMVLQDDLVLDDDFTVSIAYSRGISEPSKRGYTVGNSTICLRAGNAYKR